MAFASRTLIFYLEQIKIIKRMISRDYRIIISFGAGMLLVASCKKSSSQLSVHPTAATADLSMPSGHSSSPTSASTEAQKSEEQRDAKIKRVLDEQYGSDTEKKKELFNDMKVLNASDDYEKKFAEDRRRTMIIPAPADFKPEAAARKVRLELFVENQRIQAGQRLRFRLELTNVGREAINYHEDRGSIFNAGGLMHSSTIKFFITDRDGTRARLLYSPLEPGVRPTVGFSSIIGPPSGATKAEKEKWFIDTQARSHASAKFDVKILPGETLRSLGDGDSEKEPYRTLVSSYHFDRPGRYQLQVELDDRPSALTPRHIKDASGYASPEQLRQWHQMALSRAIGPVSSNAVELQVKK